LKKALHYNSFFVWDFPYHPMEFANAKNSFCGTFHAIP